mgnify:CR=1 FL=1
MQKQENTTTPRVLSILKGDCFFDELKWITKAISKDETREAITVVNIEKDQDDLETSIVATDGRRLHILTLPSADQFPAGRYNVTVTAREIIFRSVGDDFPTFPNWKSIIPDHAENPPKDRVKGVFITSKVPGALVSGFVSLINRFPVDAIYPADRIVLNDTFVSDLLGAKTLLARKKESVSWEYDGAVGRPLVVKTERGVARLTGVIMPLVVR